MTSWHHFVTNPIVPSISTRFADVSGVRTNIELYGEGAPHGDPFVESGLYPYPQPPARNHEYGLGIGRGPPPTPRQTRSVSFESPVAQRYDNRAAPTYFDPAVTPTPNRRGYAPPHAPQNLQFGPGPGGPTEQLMYTLLGKMDALLNDNRHLGGKVGELTERMTVLEQGAAASQAGRHALAQRGRAVAPAPSTRRSTRRTMSQQRSADDSDDESLDPQLRAVAAHDGASSTTDSATESEYSDREEDSSDASELHGANRDRPVVINDDMLTKSEIKAARLRISLIFRQVCNVHGKEWPNPLELRFNPITKQQYPTPNFASDVLDAHNCDLFRMVGERAQRVLGDTAALPKSLKRLKSLGPIVWDLDFTMECSKKTFRSFKKDWTKFNSIGGREQMAEREKRDRRMQRRVTKSEQLGKAVDALDEKLELDTGFLHDSIHPDYLSDEVSGPDSDTEEPEMSEQWKFRLATLAGLPNDPSSLKNANILEVLIPDWREDLYSDFLHSLARRHKKKIRGGNSKQYHRVCAGRVSKRLPRYAPYNCGIKQDWLAENKQNPAFALQLTEWGKYEAPDGSTYAPLP
ncbi:hypothetical protein R3P38DRAFT_3291784 [Favolaschia claudopus]|uniref:Uncharacterized protein n=1 Tax=Favolaschia claudopus TaxID=2862362 RepID=A0AAV9ZMP4_9AGAR